VVAGMRRADAGFMRVDVTRSRLAAMKAALGIEIERQRGDHMRALVTPQPNASDLRGRNSIHPVLKRPVTGPVLIRILPLAPMSSGHSSSLDLSVLRLR